MRTDLGETRPGLGRAIIPLVLLALISVACGGPTTSPPGGSPEPSSSVSSSKAPAATSGDGQAVDELTVAIAALGTEQVDPTQGFLDDKPFMRLLYSYLFDTNLADTEESATAGVAESYEWSEDGTVLTAQLKQGILFHNGEELKAEDVQFSLDRLRGEGATSAYSQVARDTIESIEVLGDYEVQITLTQPSLTFVPMLSPIVGGTDGMIYPKAYFEEVGEEGFVAAPIGSGPYRLVDREVGSFMEFEAFEDYFLGEPNVGRFRFDIVPEESTRRAMLESGQADIVEVSREEAPTYDDAGYNTFSDPGGDAIFLFPHAWPDVDPNHPLLDPNVRRALFIAINREEINEFVLAGSGKLTGSFLGEEIAIGGKAVDPYPYDADQASQLLRDAGWDEGELEIVLHVALKPGLPEAEDIGQAIAADWEVVGVRTRIVALDFGTLVPRIQERTIEQPSVMLNSVGLRAIYGPLMTIYFGCPTPIWVMCDEEVGEMIVGLGDAVDIADYGEMQQAIDVELHERAMIDNLAIVGRVFATNDKVGEWDLGLTAFDLNFRYLALKGLLE
jgi:peptide/nickel transport system substrate-binding protein